MRLCCYSLTLLAALLWSCGPGAEAPPPAGTAPLLTHYAPAQAQAKGLKVVLVSGDEEYRSEEALPQLARILTEHHGFDCTVLFAQDPAMPGVINPNYPHHIPGLEQLQQADLLILFTRFRALPDTQMAHFETYLKAGRPIIGLRTATHAFRFQDTLSPWRHWGNYYQGPKEAWAGGFGQLVLGTNWYRHHGHHKHQSTRGVLAKEAQGHPVLNGIKTGEIWGPTDVYGIELPLDSAALPLVYGQVIDNTSTFDEDDYMYGMRPTHYALASTNPGSDSFYNPNDPMMPIAWLKPYQLPGGEPGQAFTSTMGASTDFLDEEFRRLLINATYYLTGETVPARAKVDTVGHYKPTAFEFHEDSYWQDQQLRVPASKP